MINKELTLEITKHEGEWICDCPQILGSPIIGRGHTKNIALATWVQRNIKFLNIKEIKIKNDY